MRLTRSDHHDLEPTVRLRPPRSSDNRQFIKLLPWFTPIIVYRLDDEDWVRWHVPQSVAEDSVSLVAASAAGRAPLRRKTVSRSIRLGRTPTGG